MYRYLGKQDLANPIVVGHQDNAAFLQLRCYFLGQVWLSDYATKKFLLSSCAMGSLCSVRCEFSIKVHYPVVEQGIQLYNRIPGWTTGCQLSNWVS